MIELMQSQSTVKAGFHLLGGAGGGGGGEDSPPIKPSNFPPKKF